MYRSGLTCAGVEITLVALLKESLLTIPTLPTSGNEREVRDLFVSSISFKTADQKMAQIGHMVCYKFFLMIGFTGNNYIVVNIIILNLERHAIHEMRHLRPNVRRDIAAISICSTETRDYGSGIRFDRPIRFVWSKESVLIARSRPLTLGKEV